MLIFFTMFLVVVTLLILVRELIKTNRMYEKRYDRLWVSNRKYGSRIQDQVHDLLYKKDQIKLYQAIDKDLQWQLQAAHMMLETVIDYYERGEQVAPYTPKYKGTYSS